jgi:hypothetical protein
VRFEIEAIVDGASGREPVSCVANPWHAASTKGKHEDDVFTRFHLIRSYLSVFNSKSLKSLVIGSLLTISSASMAATSGTVDLSGTVETTLTVEATTAGDGMALNLLPGTNRIAFVGTIVASTNNETGLTISTSDGSLTKTGGTAIAYKSAAAASPPPTNGFDAADEASSAAGEFARDLYIVYSPATFQDPGEYTGQITVSVSDN